MFIRTFAPCLAGLLACAAPALGQPSLTLATLSGCAHDPGRTVVVCVNMTGATDPVVGGQFFLEYDSSTLTLENAAPGSPPFTLEVYRATGTPGLIDYAVGVPGGGPGTVADTTMATFTFHASQDLCDSAPALVSFRAHTPPTRMTDDLGAPIVPTLADLSPIRVDTAPPSITCPPGAVIHTADPSAPATSLLGAGWGLEGGASLVNSAGSGTDISVMLDAHDHTQSAAVLYTPPSPLPFGGLVTLSADFNMQCGRFGCGAPRFVLTIDQDNSGGDSPGDLELRILWGTFPNFDDCPGYGVWNNTGDLIASPDHRYDTSEFPGGASFDSYAHALFLIGSKAVLHIRAVADETCAASACSNSCASVAGRVLLLDNMNINGTVQHFLTATATDGCTPAPAVAATRDDGHPLTDPYPAGQTVITWTATDACGNTASCQQLITVFGPCGSADYNCDGDLGTDLDIEDFFACLAGNCPPPPCTSTADFNGDGDIGTDADIEAFFRVLAGGTC